MSISLTSIIQLRPLSQQLEDGVLVVGYGGQFLELPAEGLPFLTWLEQGLSLEMARQRFEAEFNPFPQADLLEMLDAFQEYDFIATVDGQIIPPRHALSSTHNEWVSPRLARALFSTPMLLAAIALWISLPEIWPHWSDYFWIQYNFIIILVSLLIWLMVMACHETAHLIAARAKGIEATITWTRRLGFIPMSQTIMHNIWAVPRQSRLLPIAGGMMFDLIWTSLIIYLLAFQAMGWLILPLIVTPFLKSCLLISTLALISQFWLFSQMDGYYLLSAILGQRNLQADTYDWFKFKLGYLEGVYATDSWPEIHLSLCYSHFSWRGAIYGAILVVTIPHKIARFRGVID